MKLPVLWIVSALAAGILLAGPGPAMPSMRPMVWLALAVAALLVSLGLLLRRSTPMALGLGLLSWVFLGALAARVEQVGIPANHVSVLLGAGGLDTSEALRDRGRLREPISRARIYI